MTEQSASNPVQVIAVDGPAGAGKSSVARALAARLGWHYLDTGAMYRAVAAAALQRQIDPTDEDAVGALAEESDWLVTPDGEGRTQVSLDGQDMTGHLRTPEVTALVSRIADNGRARKKLRRLQRQIGEVGRVIMEGRDIGVYVFPDAQFRFFLDADLDERARRRLADLREAGREATLEQVKEDMHRRDEADSARAGASMEAARQAPGVRIVDTTDLTFDQVVQTLARIVIDEAGVK
jgi:cytidylate kinase